MVAHKDIDKLSIYANRLQERYKVVMHGMIREASLVLAGANPGASIDHVYVQHGDDEPELARGEAIIIPDVTLEHADRPTPDNPDPDHDGDNDLMDPKDGGIDPATATIKDVMDTLTPIQMQAVYAVVGAATEGQDDDMAQGEWDPTAHIDEDSTVGDVFATLNEVQHSAVFAVIGQALESATNDQEGGTVVHRNVFDQTVPDAPGAPSDYRSLSHADQEQFFKAWKSAGGNSLREFAKDYFAPGGEAALKHGIDNIDVLFPYDQAVSTTPEFISRRMEWVAGVLGGVHKTPFARIRSWTADISFDDARAKGYVKGNLKKEEFIEVARRITTPTTVYKKQKMDRDDIVDITEFDVIAWLQTEMRLLLDEEVARCILVGDGRAVDDDDHVNANNIRPIFGDDPLYVTNLQVDLTSAGTSADDIIDAVVTGMRFYRGSGNPVMYTTLPYLSKLLLVKDALGRRLYSNRGEVANAMGIADIIPCEALEATTGLVGIIVNLTDYTVGMDRGGQVSMFDFFDIDYNAQKYLIETRASGAMTKWRGAITIQEFTGAGGLLADPTVPTFNTSTGVVTIPTLSHVTYVVVNDTDQTEGSALTPGAQSAISAGATVHIRAKAASTYAFVDDQSSDWHFTRTS